MEWGIIKDNFNLPEKRWDPLQTYLENQQKIGFFSYITPFRGTRHIEYRHKPPLSHEPSECPILCPIIKGNDPAIPVYTDQAEFDPFSEAYPITRNYESYDAISIVNKFPVFGRVDLRTSPGISYPSGVCLVSMPSPHYENMEDISHNLLTKLLRNIRNALQYAVKCAQRHAFRQIIPYVFFNVGKKSGASIKHLHAQIYLDVVEDPSPTSLGLHTLTRLLAQEKYYSQHKRCFVCDLIDKTIDVSLDEELKIEERTLIEGEFWLALSAYAPTRNGQIRVIPKKHRARLTDLTDEELSELADIFRKINSSLNEIGIERDRTTVFYQKPYLNNPVSVEASFHLYLDIFPFNYIGGVEYSGDCLKVIELPPEVLAETLKKHIKMA